MLDFMLLQRGNLNSQTEAHDMRYIKHILQIEYAGVSRKADFGGTSIMNKSAVCYFYFAGRQISHHIACSIFFSA